MKKGNLKINININITLDKKYSESKITKNTLRIK